MNKYLYYPGCSMGDVARAYKMSLIAIKEKLALEFQEIDDWNCCGATEYSSVNQIPAHALVSRNLALAQEQSDGLDRIMATCSACYLNLSKTEHYMKENKTLNDTINTALEAGGLHYEPGSFEIQHLLDVLYNDIGIDAIEQHVVQPLKGLRVAAYYGCLLFRPDMNQRWATPESHMAFEELIEALGAKAVDYPMKAECCSGHMPQIDRGSAYEMIRRIIAGAADQDADVIATLCPMCQLNLDMYQNEMNRFFRKHYQVPVLYMTQLIGLAYGFNIDELGIGSEFIKALPALEKIGTEPHKVIGKPENKKSEGLPMPKMTK